MRNRAAGETLKSGRWLFLAWAAVLALAVFAPNLQAQTAHAGIPERPAFDAVSIKLNKNPGVGKINLTQSGGHLTASNVSVKFLIIQAYQFGHLHLGPNPAGANWIDSEHFDIEAEAAGNPTVEDKRIMLQMLLADRFKLMMHHETRQLPQFALVLSKAGKTGPQLRPHTEGTKCVEVPAGQPQPPIVPGAAFPPPCGGLRVVNTDLVGQDVTMEQLAGTLGVFMGRNVVNRTGLSGTFDVTLHFETLASPDLPPGPNGDAPDPSGAPSIYTALQEQLGLKLESTTGPEDVLIIDHVEQPSEN